MHMSFRLFYCFFASPLNCSYVYAIHMDREPSSLRGYIQGERDILLLDHIDTFERIITDETRSLRAGEYQSIGYTSLAV